MIKIIKFFTDRYDNLKPYNVGEIKDFGYQRNKYLVDNGYAEWVKQTKVLEPELKQKPIASNTEKKPIPKRRKK